MSYTLGGSGQYKLGQAIAANGTDGAFLPFQLWAGESDITTTDEVIAEFGVLPPYTVMARRADGKLVPCQPKGTDALGQTAASGTITFSGQPTAGTDNVTINGVEILFVAAPAYASGSITFTAQPAVGDTLTLGNEIFTFVAANANPVGNQIPLGAADTATAEALYDFINANPSAYGVSASYASGGLVIDLEAIAEGVSGNSIVLTTTSASITVSGAGTLTGGVAIPVGNQVALGASDAGTAENLAEFIEANEAALLVQPEYNGDSAPLVVTLRATNTGTGGNSITLAKSGANIAVSGATLTGGSATASETLPESVPVAVLATGIDTTGGDLPGPVYIAGVFNWNALVWPPGVTTLAQAKALTDHVKFSVKSLG